MARESSVALGVLLVMCCVSWSSAMDYIVDWDTGVNYTTWASNKSFQLGDMLIFGYTTGVHTVDEVSSSDYASCSTSNALSTDSSGQTVILLSTAGTHYFICGIPGHCAGGMKLAVTVAAAEGPTVFITGTPGFNNSMSRLIPELVTIALAGLLTFLLGVF